MSVSFVRIDDRMIHGQTVTRWAKEMPCDGIIAVNDAASTNPVLNKHISQQLKVKERKVLFGHLITLKMFKKKYLLLAVDIS